MKNLEERDLDSDHDHSGSVSGIEYIEEYSDENSEEYNVNKELG